MEGGLRLNLGAGNKRFKGWVNVDLPVTRKSIVESKTPGQTYEIDPEIQCDLRAIPLPDNTVDEAMAIHVIEHFYPWDAPKVLTEWLRVLKPGAQLAVECPCWDKIVYLAQVPNIPPSFTFWGVFGDPRYEEPAMTHHWCYNERQLVKLMSLAGFEDVHGEPVRFHEPIRDMRVVGTKSAEEPRIQLPQ